MVVIYRNYEYNSHNYFFCSREDMYEQLKIDIQQFSPVFYEYF